MSTMDPFDKGKHHAEGDDGGAGTVVLLLEAPRGRDQGRVRGAAPPGAVRHAPGGRAGPAEGRRAQRAGRRGGPGVGGGPQLIPAGRAPAGTAWMIVASGTPGRAAEHGQEGS